MPIYYALLEGMVVFTIGVKVRKRGAMLIYCIIQGIVGFYLPYTLTYILMGIISEIILSKTGYDNTKGLTVSYILQQVGLCFGSTVYPYVLLSKDDGMMSVKESENLKYVMTHAGSSIMNWGWIVLMIATAAVAFVGSILGKRVVRKHNEFPALHQATRKIDIRLRGFGVPAWVIMPNNDASRRKTYCRHGRFRVDARLHYSAHR